MFIEAFKYKQWSDLRALVAIKNIDEEKYPDAFAHCLQQLNHIVIVEDLFKACILGEPEPHADTNSLVVPSFEELKLRLCDSGGWYINYVQNIKQPEKERLILFTFVDGKRGAMTCEEILFHIINHGTYHRGVISLLLDQSHVPHPADTYTMYIHQAEPERRNKSQS